MAFRRKVDHTTEGRQRFFRNRIPIRFRGRRPLKAQTLTGMIPNITTLMALCCGMTAIRFALLEKWEFAIVSVLLAAILDALDGRLARLLNSTSRFGAELDSFADFLNFGVAPALIMYLRGLSHWGEMGWAIALFFTICMVLRLARFNVMSVALNQPAWLQGFFIGVPAPLGGFLGLYPIIIQHAFPSLLWVQFPACYAFFMILAGGLMVSRIPTFSLKKLIIPSSFVMPFLLALFTFIGLLYSYPWLILTLIGVGYIAMIPFAFIAFKAYERKTNIHDDDVLRKPVDN